MSSYNRGGNLNRPMKVVIQQSPTNPLRDNKRRSVSPLNITIKGDNKKPIGNQTGFYESRKSQNAPKVRKSNNRNAKQLEAEKVKNQKRLRSAAKSPSPPSTKGTLDNKLLFQFFLNCYIRTRCRN